MFKTVFLKILYYLFYIIIFIFSIMLFLQLIGSPVYETYLSPYVENIMNSLFK